MQIQTIRGDDEEFSVEMDGEHVAIDIEVDDNFPTITTYRFSKEAAQALGTALLAAASGGDAVDTSSVKGSEYVEVCLQGCKGQSFAFCMDTSEADKFYLGIGKAIKEATQ